MRRFVLRRHRDFSGMSGVGFVAEGVVFSDGRVALRWITNTASTVLYDSVQDMQNIHGHGSATVVEYVDKAGL